MSAWKQFLASDIIVNPFVVNKGFTCYFSADSDPAGYGISIYGIGYYGEEETPGSSSCGGFVDRFTGTNLTSSFNLISDPKTGISSSQYERLIYESVKQLYYTNYISSSTGDVVAQPVLFPGADESGDVLIGGIESPLYDNFLQSTLVPTRFFPTASNAEIGVISVSSKLFGEYIVPGSLIISSGSNVLIDDGEGNLIISGSGLNFGNVIYPQGMIILTNSASYSAGGSGAGGYLWGSAIYGTAIWGGTALPSISGFISGDVTCSFSSSMTIYETQYKCTLRESEFNYTLNRSARDADGVLKDNVTGSYFSPYVTTVGLYDEAQNLLAIGKLAQPLPTSATTDTTILVNIDM
jgi:hypothetical protein